MVTIIKNGKWRVKDLIVKSNPVYRVALEKYLNSLDPLFLKAQEQDEFDFICTLLRVRGIQDPGWGPWENTLNAFHKLMKLECRVKDFETIRHLFLWLYGHIVEASEPYETVANLINIVGGGTYIIENFPDKQYGKKFVPQSPSDKIEAIISKTKIIGLPDSATPFQEVFDRELRNSIFHSDYSLYNGEVRLLRKYGKTYSHEQILAIMNRALAYLAAFEIIISRHTKSYTSPKVVKMYPKHTREADEDAITIIRKGHGVIGLQSKWTLDQIKAGKIQARLGRFMKYESKMLAANPALVILPSDRIAKINRILSILPSFLRRPIINIINRSNYI